jgi:hypothetical protein
MTTWLENCYPDRSHQVDYQPMMRNPDLLKGDVLDQAFLEDMIPHHMPALIIGGLLFLVFVALVVFLLILLFRTNKNQESAVVNWRDILDNRYVKGEISRDEYLDLRRSLK